MIKKHTTLLWFCRSFSYCENSFLPLSVITENHLSYLTEFLLIFIHSFSYCFSPSLPYSFFLHFIMHYISLSNKISATFLLRFPLYIKSMIFSQVDRYIRHLKKFLYQISFQWHIPSSVSKFLPPFRRQTWQEPGIRKNSAQTLTDLQKQTGQAFGAMISGIVLVDNIGLLVTLDITDQSFKRLSTQTIPVS